MPPRRGPAVWRRWAVLALLARVSPVVRLLVATGLAFNVGFYLVLPFLAVHLTGDLGLSGAFVGLVLGLRMYSQQGLFFLGGALADRFGTRPVALAGIGVRVVGFGGLAVAQGAAVVLVGVVLTGVAAALFTPAIEAELARQTIRDEQTSGVARTDVFALWSVCSELGALAGPALGALLIALGATFPVVCAVAAAVFVLILLAHWRLLPGQPPGSRGVALAAGWRDVLANRRFLAFAVAFSGYLTVYNQLYLALPLELGRRGVDPSAVGWLFTLAGALVVAGQLPVTRWSQRSLGTLGSLVAGFVALAVAAVVTAVGVSAVPERVLLVAAALVVLLTVGQMLVLPAGREAVLLLSGEAHLGTYLGALASIGAIGVLVCSMLVGQIFATTDAAVPWLVIAAFPAAGVVGFLMLGPALRGLDSIDEARSTT
ncbi:MFS transporter [Micromonospora deserti]|uniref:MFS transporter n=1 Tax=Micromonospora deserti TaxID=2070366 RepID=A0A2W2DQG1_9ACTN|nr:MFS transporter [Micromonospora deserti]